VRQFIQQRLCSAALIGLLGLQAAPVQAQPGDPYNRIVNARSSFYWGYTFLPYEDPGLGVAAIIQAQGDFLIKNQQSKLIREEVRKKRLEYRRLEIEQWEWTRDIMAGAGNRERQRILQAQVEHSRNRPPLVEILTATPLNNLLDELKSKPDLAAAGAIQVEPNWLEHINVSVDGRGNVGLLKGQRVFWPQLFYLPEFVADRDKIDQLLARCKEQALVTGGAARVDPGMIRELNRAVDECQKHVKKAIRSGVLDADYSIRDLMEATKHLDLVEASIAVFTKPDAAFYFISLRGATVGELVANMSKEGVHFAPATAGGERYYQALHDALANAVTQLQGPR
jgi:hypothetical protein